MGEAEAATVASSEPLKERLDRRAAAGGRADGAVELAADELRPRLAGSTSGSSAVGLVAKRTRSRSVFPLVDNACPNAQDDHSDERCSASAARAT